MSGERDKKQEDPSATSGPAPPSSETVPLEWLERSQSSQAPVLDGSATSGICPSFPAAIRGEPRTPLPRFEPGATIDDFEIISVLGDGAFGTVYLARQTSLNRPVALKVTADRGQEARTMASLEHDFIVRVFSEKVDADRDLRLLCMQYVPGTTLDHVIDELHRQETGLWNGTTILGIIDKASAHRAPLDPALLRDRELLAACDLAEAVCLIGQRIAEALAHAHRQGVLHRDVKPANVLVNQYGRPLLADFSLSFQSREQGKLGSAVFGGTLSYMAPEHLDAFNPQSPTGPDQVDERSDIYAVGVVLYEMLCGTRPFKSSSATPDSLNQVEAMARDRRAASLAKLCDCLPCPRMLAQIIGRCLEPDPKRRYQSAEELARALSGCGELSRVEREMPPAGPLTRFALWHPFIFIILVNILPQIAASAANVMYCFHRVVSPLTADQQATFGQLFLWYNVYVAATVGPIIYLVVVPVVRTWRKLSRLRPVKRALMAAVRKKALRFTRWAVILVFIGWFPYVSVMPLGVHFLAGPIAVDVAWHLTVSFLLTAMMALIYTYFVVEFVVVRAMYTRLWTDAYHVRQTAAEELKAIPNRIRFFQALAGLTPLAAAVLAVTVGPERFTASSYQTFRILTTVLIAAGIAGFALATAVGAVLHRTIAVLTEPKR